MLQLPTNPVVAIIGATGAVGREMIAILEQRRFPLASLRLFASPRSRGTRIAFRANDIVLEDLAHGAVPEGIDLALFSAGKGISTEWCPKFRDAGALVIDNSSAFRADPACPLVVPEVNPHALEALGGPAIIANPNCSTIIALVAVTPLHRAIGIERMLRIRELYKSGRTVPEHASVKATFRNKSRPKRAFLPGQNDTRPWSVEEIKNKWGESEFSHEDPVE